MDFESRFKSLFKDEGQLPAPLPVSSVKRRKSFSEKFFKSASGSTLKLSSKHALKIRQKLAFREKSVSRERLSPSDYDNGETGEKKSEIEEKKEFDFEPPFLSSSPRSLSSSVECLPISENTDSYLPVSSHSSVITLSKFNTFKVPSNKFGTFGREQAINSSPYGRIFKGRINRSRHELNSLNFDEPDTPISSPLSYTLPVTPFLDSSIASSISVAESLNDLKANFYGQSADKVSLPRTDFSCRISPIYGKNAKESFNTLTFLNSDSRVRHSKQIETPKISNSVANGIKNGSVSSDDFSDQSETQESDTKTRPTSPYDTQVINDFHKELLAKCAKIKTNDQDIKSLGEKTSLNVPNNFNVERVTNNLQVKKVSTQSHSSQLAKSPKPEVFPKPSLSKTLRSKSDLALKLESVLKSDSVYKSRSASVYKTCKFSSVTNLKPFSPKPDVSPSVYKNGTLFSVSKAKSISPKPDISPKPENLSKPNVPGKPQRLKSIEINNPPYKLNISKPLQEINNNCIVVKNTNIDTSSQDKLNDEYNQKCKSDSIMGYVNGVGAESEKIKNGLNESELLDCESKPSQPTVPTSKSDEQSGTRVKDIVASFNQVLSFSNKDFNRNTLLNTDCSKISNKFQTVQRSPSFLKNGGLNSSQNGPQSASQGPKKALSDWNLVNVQTTKKISGKYGSLSDNLNHVKIPHIIPVTSRNTSRSKF